MPASATHKRPLLTKLYNSFGGGGSNASSDQAGSSSSGYVTSSSTSACSSTGSTPLTTPDVSPDLKPSSLGNGNNNDVVDIKQLPQCWGHRGASAAYPENTLASFQQAILDGADGIESDVHISLDGTIVMFHDAYLNRTTNGKGLITKQKYKDGIDQLKTTKLPAQRICTLIELLDLLMLPENRHVLLNVDVKLDNNPEILFKLMREIIVTYEDWQTTLAPRLILGLWHAKYIEPAQRLLPYCRLAHIGVSPEVARKYFWDACSAFSLNFASLVGKEGESFRKACKAAGKDLYVWTVNDRKEMIQATRWGAKAVLTDKTAAYLKVRCEMSRDFDGVSSQVPWTHSWSNLTYYTPFQTLTAAWETFLLQRSAGPMVLPAYAADGGASGKAATIAPTAPAIAVPSTDTSMS